MIKRHFIILNERKFKISYFQGSALYYPLASAPDIKFALKFTEELSAFTSDFYTHMQYNTVS